jgi:hypothetical protein
MSIIQINPGSLEGKKLLPPKIDILSNFENFLSSEFVDSEPQTYLISSSEIRGDVTIVVPIDLRYLNDS